MILARLFGFLFPLAVILAPVPLGSVRMSDFSVWATLMTAAFACSWFPSLKNGDAWPLAPALRWIPLYLAVFAFSWAFSPVPGRGAAEAYKLAAGLLAFAAAFQIAQNRHSTRSLYIWLSTAGAAYSMGGLLQYLGALPKDWWQKAHFVSGPYMNHNHFAGLLELALPLSVGLVLSERERSKKVLFAFFSVLTALAIIFTQSRGAWIAVWISFIFLFIALVSLRHGRAAVAVFMVVSMLVAFGGFLFGTKPVVKRFESILRFEPDKELLDRFVIWKGTTAMIDRRPLTGTGPGSFEAVFQSFRPAGFRGRAGHAHNDFLELVSDLGVLAPPVVAGFLVALLMAALRVMKSSESRFRSTAAGAGLAGLTALLLHGFSDFNFHIPANWIWSCVIAGTLVSMGAKKAAPPAESRAVKVFVTALFPAVLAGGLFVGLPDRFMRTGKSLLKDGRRAEARAALARSVALAPWSDEARDWKGRAEEPAEADREFEAASRLNPFEPYYPYHRAMAVGRRSPSEAMVYYRRAAELDPGDPAIRFLCGVSLLRQNRKHEPEPERAALGFLATAVRLDPDMGVRVYRALWRYRSDLRFLESFCEAVPESLDSFLDFMKVSDRWGVYRKYLLKKEGVDPAGIEALLRAARSGTPAAISPAYFIDSPGKPFRSEGFLYANGQLSRRVTVNCRGPVRFAIRARGTRALGYYPCLVIRWDGRVVDVLTLESAEFKDYETALETGEGAHELAIEYVNDRAARAAAGGQPEDRNLWIDKMELSLPC